MAAAEKPDATLQGYLDAIRKYEREFEKWEKRTQDIIKRYRDDGRVGAELRLSQSKFNILWSNVQTLSCKRDDALVHQVGSLMPCTCS